MNIDADSLGASMNEEPLCPRRLLAPFEGGLYHIVTKVNVGVVPHGR